MDEQTPLLTVTAADEHRTEDPNQKYIWAAIYISISVNVVLFFVKVEAFIVSMSLAVVASLLDSFLDLVSQCVIWYSLNTTHFTSPNP